VIDASKKAEIRWMSYNAQQCFERARECECMASHANDRDAKAAFIECARQWLELARQKQELLRD
jgi:hypothetical protein